MEGKQALVEGLITTLETGAEGTISIADDEAVLENMPLNREIPATREQIFGPFSVVGDAPGGFRSLSPIELECSLDMPCLEHSQEAFPGIIAQLDGDPEWIEMRN